MRYDELYIGMCHEEVQHISTNDVLNFAKVSKDANPLHLDEEFVKNTIFKKPIVHGMLIGAFFSKVIATDLPGAGSVYINQDLTFLKPIYHNCDITIKVVVVELKEAKKIVILKTECFVNGLLSVDGKAVVKCLH